ncbi:hypothetical protein ACF08M_05850 [Streptomyces sp. NPDC015032]|uniref:hypothetical protein n=1 Tax=Streptomyces sp. NPDC015032 TaxID=3364937 RepID=UPI0036FBFCD0
MSTPQPPSPGADRPDGEAETLHLADTPGYPLARSVQMPDTLDYPTGSLSFRLGALQLRPEGRLEPLAEETCGGTRRVTHRIPALVLTGRYALDTQPDAVPQIDTAGNLRPLADEARQPTLPAGARPDGPHPDEGTVREWTDRARTHRAKLMRTENGRKLLTEYGTHNETYYDIFNGDSEMSKNLRDEWAKGGVTRRMSQHTYDVTDPEAPADGQHPVNDWHDPEGPNVTYNTHAWIQRTTLATTLVTEAVRIKHKDHGKSDRFKAAAKAIESFSKAVQQTGNDGSQVNSMTQDHVYAAVEQHSGNVPAVSDEEMARYDGLAAFREEAAQALQEEQEGQEEQADWIELSDQDRAVIHSIGAAAYHEEAQQEPQATDTLYTGACTARWEDIRITTRLTPDGTATDVTVELPDLALTLDDEDWRGTAAQVARERLAAMRFVRHLLQDSVAETVRYATLTGITGYLHPQDGRS